MCAEDSGRRAAAPDIRAIAESVHRRGMGTPAIFFLEAHKPLTSIANFAAHLCSPVLVPLFGHRRISEICWLLENPGSVEELIQELERLRESGQN